MKQASAYSPSIRQSTGSRFRESTKATGKKKTQSPSRWFFIALILFLPLHVSKVVLDKWFVLPPKPTGDGPDYEAIGYGLSQGHGWSTSVSSAGWRSVYQDVQHPESGLDYSVHLARRGPVLADTNRPPLFPLCIAAIYQIAPRGPIAFGIIRIALACCLSIACAVALAWGVSLANGMSKVCDSQLATYVGISMIAIVYSERNLRNYTTDFLTEPLALLLTQTFLFIAWWGARKGNWQWAAVTGATFAGMYLCRDVFVLWVPFVVFWLWYAYRVTSPQLDVNRLAPIHWVFASMLVFGIIGSIWWVRNCCVLESFHPLGTKGATSVMGGYCDEACQSGGEWQVAPEKRLRRDLEFQLQSAPDSAKDFKDLEIQLGKKANVQVKNWVADNVDVLPGLFINRIIMEWNPYRGKAMFLKLFAILGMLWLLRYNRVALIWLVGPLAINTVVVAMTYSVGGRFLVPTYGPIYILAAFGFSGTITHVKLLGNKFFWKRNFIRFRPSTGGQFDPVFTGPFRIL